MQFRHDGQWTTLSAGDDNPAGIGLEYLNDGFAAKVTALPTGDDYTTYEFRTARVVDDVATTDHREVSIVVIPDTPGNLRGGWNLRHYPDALTFEWDAASGNPSVKTICYPSQQPKHETIRYGKSTAIQALLLLTAIISIIIAAAALVFLYQEPSAPPVITSMVAGAVGYLASIGYNVRAYRARYPMNRTPTPACKNRQNEL